MSPADNSSRVKPSVILASASPRRRDLLALIGIEHVVMPADIDESVVSGEPPEAYTERLSREKAIAIAGSLTEAMASAAETLIIAADTTVVIDGEILGKPANPTEAVAMLSKLSGRTHTVVTGLACWCDGHVLSAVENVEVTFRTLTIDEIVDYVATGEPMDKAGSYGIQGFGATIVERINGDYFSVMGLPLARLVLLMRELGIQYRFNSSIDTLTSR